MESPPVGASLLAMDVNDNAGCLTHSGACTSIASRLAPTGGGVCQIAGTAKCLHKVWNTII
ncbi:hypothetical protein DKY63_07435 [Pseudomonas putida]|uniref:Uncharacterized protein n=1 Tax=Pseudomonas putida TaxID=303 RepID=A0A2Z4RFF0_PSEPU|nr:hypothetical protein DKY63_07435 [Pseudomonas putida]